MQPCFLRHTNPPFPLARTQSWRRPGRGPFLPMEYKCASPSKTQGPGRVSVSDKARALPCSTNWSQMLQLACPWERYISRSTRDSKMKGWLALKGCLALKDLFQRMGALAHLPCTCALVIVHRPLRPPTTCLEAYTLESLTAPAFREHLIHLYQCGGRV